MIGGKVSLERFSYIHPNADVGVESHRFHREKLVRVRAELLEPGENQALSRVLKASEVNLPENGRLLLSEFGLKPIKGLPIIEDGQEYVDGNALFIDNTSNKADRMGISNPGAGRSVTLSEGWIFEEGQVCLDHQIKGSGRTRSAPLLFLKKNTGDKGGSDWWVGLSTGGFTDVLGTDLAREKGVLTPRILPSMDLNEVVIKGKKVNDKVKFNNTLSLVHRAWGSDRRLNSYYRATSPYFIVSDLDLIAREPEISLRIFNTRARRFIKKVQVVNQFNKDYRTNFFVGCSKYFDGEYTLHGYSKAFLAQMVANTSAMIAGDIWHCNLSAQNVSEAGELGDWGSHGSVNAEGDLVIRGYKIDPGRLEESRAKLSLRVVRNTYLAQSLITALSGEKVLPIKTYWNMVRNCLPETSLVTSLDWQELCNQTKALDTAVWEEAFRNVSNSIRRV